MHTRPDRIGLLDCLRGVALFGVLFVNMAWFAAGGLTDAPLRSAASWTLTFDRWVGGFMQVFVYAKANTLFTLLFGIGFSIQMGRLESVTANAVAVYQRRLVFLLVLGCVHLFGLWQGEILHIYALAGFALLPLRRWSTAALLAGACLLILVVHPLLTQLATAAAAPLVSDPLAPRNLEALRYDAFVAGSYVQVIGAQWQAMGASGYFGLGLLAWISYALGRFLLGVSVARTTLLTEPDHHLGTHAAVALIGLPLGVAATLVRWPLQWIRIDPAHWRTLVDTMRLLGTLMMTASYVSWIAIGWTDRRFRKALEVFLPIGQMALTNYVTQTVFNMLIFFGFGLGLVSRVGMTQCLLLSIVFFAFQAITSAWWLRHHTFGPLEWLWRWFTHRRRPVWYASP